MYVSITGLAANCNKIIICYVQYHYANFFDCGIIICFTMLYKYNFFGIAMHFRHYFTDPVKLKVY